MPYVPMIIPMAESIWNRKGKIGFGREVVMTRENPNISIDKTVHNRIKMSII